MSTDFQIADGFTRLGTEPFFVGSPKANRYLTTTKSQTSPSWGKGHVVDKIETDEQKVIDMETGETKTIVHYRIVIDTNKLGYLKAVFL